LGVTRNPWNQNRIPGGSSGGSAVAVSAGMSPVALGSDTGGSVRQPAAHCGVCGIKPTWGTSSRYGLVAYSSSLDQIGCFGRTAGDLALTLAVIAGADPLDATTHGNSIWQTASDLLSVDVKRIRIGWVPKLMEKNIDPEIASAVRNGIESFGSFAEGVHESSWPFAEQLTAVYYIIAMSEASSNLGRFDGVRYTSRGKNPEAGLDEMYTQSRGLFFGEEVRRRILLGTHSLSSGYYRQFFEQASRVRRLVQNALLKEFARVDVIALPTTATTATRIDGDADPVREYQSDKFTVAANLAGFPALSMPCGFSSDGLPIGLQLIAAPHREDVLLSLANQWQKNTDWHLRRPGK
jgi:aspartyl-tRNA(Asn)/glutamyl-tRNA(Gln) amidotransferase subunit A